MENRWYWLGGPGTSDAVVQYNFTIIQSYRQPAILCIYLSIILYPANVTPRYSLACLAWQVHLHSL